MDQSDRCLLLGTVIHCQDDADGQPRLEAWEQGGVLIEGGRITRSAEAAELSRQLAPGTAVHDYRGKLIVPGFIDAHIHLPQTDIIGSYGAQLLEWLDRYAFPAEARFGDPAVAAETALFFLDELLRNGTTTAVVLGSVHAHSVEALFSEARSRRQRLIAGKLLMDRNCPARLRDGALSGCAASEDLIRRWHGVDRLAYAITPRFAPTSSEAQLGAVAELAAAYPSVYVHSHLAESPAELRWVGQVFPGFGSYLEVYRHYGLLRPRSVYAHCIHLRDCERRAMAEAGAAAVFCPTSNLFLGSGLFDHAATRRAGVPVALGTDVGAGSSFSMLRTAAAAYQVSALRGQPLSPAELLDLMTRAGARALDLGRCVGTLAPGMEADCVVLDPAATALTARRTARCESLEELLFAVLTLGDDRHVHAVYIDGVCRYRGAAGG